jgi:2-polyprenyl-3-methyl-5-hydroxy-6-metoxy-1,4-benzoquinol methylase
VRELRAQGREAWLYLAEKTNANRLIENANFDKAWIIGESEMQDKSWPDKTWECVILDRFQTLPDEFDRWKKLAPVIGIDEGGPHRAFFDFLIDILPNDNLIKPNLSEPSLLPLPEKKTKREKSGPQLPLKVLISFGQEDAAGLGLAAAEAVAAKNGGSMEVTLLRGTLSNEKSRTWPPMPHTLFAEALPNLSERLAGFDLVITHIGLTSYEALYAGVPVLLLSPGRYHERLAKKAGFFSAGAGKNKAKNLCGLLFEKNAVNIIFINKLKDRCEKLAVKYNLDKPPSRTLASLINDFRPSISCSVSRNCLVCGAALYRSASPVLARFPDRSYLRCKSCGIINMNRLNQAPIEYGREYFFEFYQKQYGKTYIEDFPNLALLAKRRLALIKRVGRGGKDLLDIGCAYGPFLAAAREDGYSPRGIDPAEDAVRYVVQNLDIPAVQGLFPPIPGSLSSFPPCYDVVTLWYVIEHVPGCAQALEEIKKILRPGGVLAFATPSFSGISGRKSIKRFLENSPADHWTVWSASSCRKALKRAGFDVKIIISTGHHPERFPLLGKLGGSRKGPLYLLLNALSRFFSMGDTIEVYASLQAKARMNRSKSAGGTGLEK